jgi:hypothetical protein
MNGIIENIDVFAGQIRWHETGYDWGNQVLMPEVNKGTNL